MSKKKNAMGTIYPQRIKDAISGENTKKIQSGYTQKTIHRKNGDTWFDDNGKEWEFKNGIVMSVPKFKDVRVPVFCPKCDGVMGKRSKDVEVYYKFGFCLNCLIERDAQMMRDGTYEEYQKKYVKSKQIGFFIDAKAEIEEYLESMKKGYIEYPTEDGKLEKWEGEDLQKAKAFWEDELKTINKTLDKLNGKEVVEQEN